MFIKTLHEIKEKFPKNNAKCTKRKYIPLPKVPPLNVFYFDMFLGNLLCENLISNKDRLH